MLTRDPWIRALVIVLVAISSLYLAGLVWQIAAQFADILLLFFLAWVVAFILEPVVDRLERGDIHGRLAVSVAYFGMLIVGGDGGDLDRAGAVAPGDPARLGAAGLPGVPERPFRWSSRRCSTNAA